MAYSFLIYEDIPQGTQVVSTVVNNTNLSTEANAPAVQPVRMRTTNHPGSGSHGRMPWENCFAVPNEQLTLVYGGAGA